MFISVVVIMGMRFLFLSMVVMVFVGIYVSIRFLRMKVNVSYLVRNSVVVSVVLLNFVWWLGLV